MDEAILIAVDWFFNRILHYRSSGGQRVWLRVLNYVNFWSGLPSMIPLALRLHDALVSRAGSILSIGPLASD